MVKIIIIMFLVSLSLWGNPTLNIADSFLKAKDYKKAEAKYSEVLLNNASDKNALYGKAFSLMKQKDYLAASEFFTQLIKIDSNFKDSVYRLAFVYRKLKKYSYAVKYYKKYVELNKSASNIPDAYYGLAQTYRYMDDKVNASFYFHKYILTEKRASETKYVEKAKKRRDKLVSEFNADEKKRYDLLLGKKEIVKSENKVTVKPDNNVKVTVKPDNNTKIVTVPDNKVKIVTVKPNNKVEVVTVKPDNKVKVVTVPDNKVKVVTKSDNKIEVTNNVKKESELIIPQNIKANNDSSNNKNLNYMFKKNVDGDKLYLEQKYKEAIEAYRGYLSMPSKRREGLFKTAICYALLKQYNNSVNLLSQIIIEEQDDKKVKELLTILLSNPIVIQSMLTQKTQIKNNIAIKGVQKSVMLGNYNQALELLDILIDKIDQNSKALLYKLDILRIVDRPKEIDKTIITYLIRYPNDSLVNERYGDILKARGEKEKANRYYQKALSNAKTKAISKKLESKIIN